MGKKLKARHFRFEPPKNFVTRAREGAAKWAGGVRDAFANFLPRKKTAKSNDSAAPDPAKILFPADGRNASFSSSEGPLGAQIRDSAELVFKRQRDLGRDGRNLAKEIRGRREGAVTQVAWVIRAIVAALWGAIALQLVWAALNDATAARILGIGLVNGGDFRPLARIFGIAAFFGLLAVFAGAAAVQFAGRADNRRVRRVAHNFGVSAANLTLDFDNDLKQLRTAMDQRPRPVEAVSDLSRTHLTALEAAVFFRNVQFLTSESDALGSFNEYLKRSGGLGRSGADPLLFLGGILVGAFGMFMMLGAPEIDISLPDFDNLKYEQVEYWILMGGLVYLMAGVFAELGSDLFGSPFEDQARDEALEAARSGFVAIQAPRVDDVIQRIVDAIEVFKARVESSRSSGGAYQGDAASGAIAENTETPAWRKTPEGPRFVETGFQAAPKTFRTDAFAKAYNKKMHPSLARGSASKRGFLGLKKPSRG